LHRQIALSCKLQEALILLQGVSLPYKPCLIILKEAMVLRRLTSNILTTKMENIFWTGYSNDERHGGIAKIKNIVSRYGDIVGFRLFSDIAITITIEIEEYNIDNLYKELSGSIGIDKFEYLHSVYKKERTVYLNITFTKSTGNLAIEVPSVPG